MQTNSPFRPFRALFFVLLWVAAAAGCTDLLRPEERTPEVIRTPHFSIITVGPEDTLAGLAQTHLGSSSHTWRIARYNGVTSAKAGDRLVIPFAHSFYGGLAPNGYQIVPVLNYPKIVSAAKTTDAVSARTFESQMLYLHTNGYHTISPSQLTSYLRLKAQLPERAIVITMDTSEAWMFETAYPILKRYGLRAAIFIATRRIGTAGHMSWQNLEQMTADGFDIGTSGHSGRHLTRLGAGARTRSAIETLEAEILRPKKEITTHLKRPCRFFAYPGGLANDMIIALLKKHGYRAAFTLERGENAFFVDSFKIHRAVIGATGGSKQFSQDLKTFITADLR
ncbi:MAG: polysaccharide deacetylase family protein [Desulfatitalea sp.]|nr:polysaccharide deacetylase family protein [Desulfatitalea sp.]NNK00522.1 polysaccharide deacetylase family protein [Desulfatitalea sp.]